MQASDPATHTAAADRGVDLGVEREVDAGDCEQELLVRDRDAAATVLVGVHDTRLGPAHGGIRRWPYAGLAAARADARALARAMTWKCAPADVPAGGGKAVVIDHPGLDRTGAYRLVGRALAQLGGRFFTGPDVGTTDAGLADVQRETPFVGCSGDDGPGDLAASTARGVPGALGGVIDRAVAARLPARGVCGAANNVLADDEAAWLLHRRGVRVVPDFVANAGALILGATWHLTGRRAGPERVLRIGTVAGELLDRASAEDVPPPVLARAVARERIERAARRPEDRP